MPITAGSIVAYLELDTGKFTNGFKGALSDLKVFIDQSATVSQKLNGLSNSMSKMGSLLNKSVTLPVLGVGTAAVKTAMDFESAMSNVRAISGATGSEFERLEDKAIDLGASTVFSSTEVANAMTEMAKAGWDSQQILDGMGGVLDAAAASGEDLATVSTIVADSITTFGLAASESTRVADLLSQSANAGTISVSDLGESIKYVGPVAKTMGFEIEDVVTAITALSTAGIKGSQAGTSLRTMFARLVKPTEDVQIAMDQLGIEITDSEGNFKSLDTILSNMRSTFSKLTPEQQTYYATVLAGQEGMSGLTALLSMTQEEYDKIAASMDNAAGTAERTADVMQDNLAGAVEQLGGAMESAGIVLGKRLTPYIRDAAEIVTDLAERISEMSDEELDSAIKFAGMAAAISPVLSISSKLLRGLTTLGRGFVTVTSQTSLFVQAIGLAKNGMTDVAKQVSPVFSGLSSIKTAILSLNPYTVALTASVVALTAAFAIGFKRQEEYRAKLREETEAEKALTEAVKEQTEAREASQETISKAVEDAQQEAKANENLANKLASVVDENGRVLEGKQTYAEVIAGQLSEALGIEIDLSDGQIDNYSELSDEIYKTIDAKKALAVQEALSDEYNEALANQLDAQQQYNDTIYEQIDLQGQLAEEQAKLNDLNDEYQQKLEQYGEASNIPYVYELNEAISDQSEKVAALEDKLADNNVQLQDATENYEHWNQVVENYEGLSAAIIENDADKIDLAMLKIQEGFLTAETATRESLENQKTTLEDEYDSMLELYKRGNSNVTQEMLDNMKILIDQANSEIAKSMDGTKQELTTAFQNIGIEAPQGMIDALAGKTTDAQNTIISMFNLMKSGTQVSGEQLKTIFNGLGIAVPQSLIDSLASMEPSTQQKAIDLLAQLQYGEQAKRPEVLQQMNDLGIQVDNSVADGMDANTKRIQDVAGKIGTAGNTSMQTTLGKILRSPDIDNNTSNVAWAVAQAARSSMQSYFDNNPITATIRAVVSQVGSAASTLRSIAQSAINGSHASGLSYVPFDGYIAELHKGERVLTAEENMSYNSGNGRGGDTFIFYNTQPDPYEYARQMKKKKQELFSGI